VTYYRGMAAEALHLARTTDDSDQRASFVDCASRWLALAHEVENLQAHLAQFRQERENLQRRTH
jgi:hypothetical protein